MELSDFDSTDTIENITQEFFMFNVVRIKIKREKKNTLMILSYNCNGWDKKRKKNGKIPFA